MVSVVNVASNTKAIAVTTSSSSKSTSSTPSTNGSSSATSSSSSSPKGNPTKTTICHATASSSNPFVEITVDDNALAAHRAHQGLEDIIPAPASGCPKGGDSGSGGGGGSCSGSGDSGSSDSGSSDSGSGSGKSKSNGSGDSKSGDSDSGSGGGGAGGSQYGGCIPICHSIGSGKYVLLLVGNSALAAHQAHGDLIPAPATGCPGGSGGGDKPKCNSGRGNGSEGNSSQLIQPGTGSRGTSPTVDCDPGNSGAKNSGGD